MNAEGNALKLKVKRLITLENVNFTTPTPPLTGGGGLYRHKSAFKLPHFWIPRFENNASNSVNCKNCRNMMIKLTQDIHTQKKVLILKSAITGEIAKLVSDELSYDQAMHMLASVYANELLQPQSKIQGFITLVQQ